MRHSHKSEYYFLAGTLVADLLGRAALAARRNAARTGRAPSAAAREHAALAAAGSDLRRALLGALLGARLCRNFDRTLGAGTGAEDEDDASEWVGRLTALEQGMFAAGAAASGAAREWRERGAGRLGTGPAATRGIGVAATAAPATGAARGGGEGGRRRVVTPTGEGVGRSF